MVDEAWSSDVTSHLSQNVVMVGKVWWNDFAGYLVMRCLEMGWTGKTHHRSPFLKTHN